MSNSPKRHHIIPQFYLKLFSDNGQIEIFKLDGSKPFRTSTTRAFAENNFYRSDRDSTCDPLRFEYFLAQKESAASIPLRKLRNNISIGLPEKESISEFLLIQLTRGRDFRESINSYSNLALRDMARQSTEADIRLFHEVSFEKLLNDKEWKTMWDRYRCDDGPGFTISTETSFEQVQSFSGSSRFRVR